MLKNNLFILIRFFFIDNIHLKLLYNNPDQSKCRIYYYDYLREELPLPLELDEDLPEEEFPLEELLPDEKTLLLE